MGTWRRSVVVAVALGAAAAPVVADEMTVGEDVAPVVQSEADSLEADLTLIAESRGWTIEDARTDHAVADEIGRIAQTIFEQRPEAFVGSALSPEPGGPATLFIKGAGDAYIDELVQSAGIAIIVADQQPFSFAELEAQQLRIHESLFALTSEVAISFDIERAGVHEVIVTASELLPDESAVLEAIPEDLRSYAEVQVVEDAVVETEAAYGGMQLWRTGIPDCTSGWTVQVVGGSTRGITGAAHCSGMDTVSHPQVGHNHSLAFQLAHEGAWGDVEWYTTGQSEADDFYADVNMIRDVVSVEAIGAITVGEHVCAFGRGSMARDCSLTVAATSVTCGAANRLVRMSGNTQVGGDSGGPWYNTHIAFGAHMGNCINRDHFTPADRFDEALGVRVATN